MKSKVSICLAIIMRFNSSYFVAFCWHRRWIIWSSLCLPSNTCITITSLWGRGCLLQLHVIALKWLFSGYIHFLSKCIDIIMQFLNLISDIALPTTPTTTTFLTYLTIFTTTTCSCIIICCYLYIMLVLWRLISHTTFLFVISWQGFLTQVFSGGVTTTTIGSNISRGLCLLSGEALIG